MKSQIPRNTNIEILRFVLMCAIFLWHTFMHGFGFTHKDLGMFVYPGNLLCAFFTCSLLAPATYCFVFISGYYGIRFSWRRLLNMLLWLVLVALIYIAYSYYIGGCSIKALYFSCFPLAYNRWWFITVYILLYILSPFINVALENLPDKQICIILVVLYSILLYRLIGMVPNAGSDLLGVLFIYILSRMMAIKKVNVPMKSALIMFLSSAFLLTALLCASFYGFSTALSESLTQRLTFQLFSYCNPLIITMAVMLFYITINLPVRTNKLINFILRPTLFIYLFTQGVGFVRYRDLATMYLHEPDKYLAWFALIIGASLIVGHVIMICSNTIVQITELVLRQMYKSLCPSE